jgi:DNA invertase Pin-like site-specific DNA recombinase
MTEAARQGSTCQQPKTWGYAYVEPNERDAAAQARRIRKEEPCVHVIITDRADRGQDRRVGMAWLMGNAKTGDTILAESPMRVATSARNLRYLLMHMMDKGIAIRFIQTPWLDMPNDDETAWRTICAFADMERQTRKPWPK